MATSIRNWINRYEDYLPWRRRRYQTNNRRRPVVVRRWPSPAPESNYIIEIICVCFDRILSIFQNFMPLICLGKHPIV